MTHVIAETMNIYQELFSLKFQKLEGVQVWHEEVEVYEVKDAEKGTLLGQFYIDLFPRDDKFSHAAMFDLIKRCDFGDGY